MTEKEFQAKWLDRYKGIEDVPEKLQDEYLADAFAMYEEGGFTERFASPYDGEKKHDGRKFTVERRATYPKADDSDGDYECDLTAGPMWLIRFDGGEEHFAYPEEICRLEREAA